MRLLLVGSARERARLRTGLGATSVEIAGEFPTLAAARRSAIEADGTVVAAGDRDTADGDTRGGGEGGRVDGTEPLTAREVQVLELMAEGRSNKAIAQALRISDQTVKFHVASILGKLAAANRTEAVRRAVRGGLVTL